MLSTAKNRAYQRGLKAAGIWKGTKSRLKQWDAACVTWATKHHLPRLVDHVPVATGIVLFVAGVLLGGAIFSVVLLFVAGLASVICGNVSNKEKEQNHSVDEFIGLPTSEYQTNYEYPESGYRNGHSGYGYYSGDIKMDD